MTVTRATRWWNFWHLIARVTVTWGLLPSHSFWFCVNPIITLNHNRMTRVGEAGFRREGKAKMSYRLGAVRLRYQFRRVVWQIGKVLLALVVISLCGGGCWLVNALQTLVVSQR